MPNYSRIIWASFVDKIFSQIVQIKISGYRRTSVFRRYNVVTEEELQNVKWKPDENLGVHIGVHLPRKSGELG